MIKNKIFNNKSILITGGTGSFGKTFTEIVLKKFKPRRLIIFSRDELKQSEMAKKFPNTKYPCMRYFIGDVRDVDRLKMAMNGVDYVVHAAALKHVDSSEYNPIECVKTNVGGAENVVNAVISSGVMKTIALSTDKASDPINLYGSTKLTSDKIFVSANNITGVKNKIFAVVRYGNVIGSRGSVVPFFKEKMKESNTLPITHLEMTRFWITLEDAVKFVIDSFLRMKGGEIFLPKIPSAKITDLAKSISPKAKFKLVGIRPGEKLHEKMCSINEARLTLEFKKFYLIKPTITFFERNINYSKNSLGEKGKSVSKNFEYRSDNNKDFLTINQLKKIIKNF
tara:strand:- start:1014 stop:2030 length:1017 start_codon:yes stop_codon:yes gene_type:complete